ncbi:MAG: aminopeptidase P family protein [Clostridia bacterium]|nr:aminopeptidase P family protein [Clostridia bacterium]
MTQLQRLQKTLCEKNIEGVLISSCENQYYLSGFDFSDGYILVTQKNAYLLCDFRYIEAAKEAVKELTVIRPETSMRIELAALCKENSISELLIEEHDLTYGDFGLIAQSLEDISILPGVSKLLNAQRAVKLPYELELISKAQEMTDQAFNHILTYISTDRTESEIAIELEYFMRSLGADGIAFKTIAVSGTASSLPHGVPSKNKLSRGFLTLDFGAKYQGYCSDMTRTVAIGKPTDEMISVYNTVLSAQKNALDNIRAGLSCRDADALARNIIADKGYGKAFGHSLGHGVGLFVHEEPRLSPSASADSLLEVGNVVTVEPGIYLEGRFGCRIEDMIAIEENGQIRNFTKSPKELIVL